MLRGLERNLRVCLAIIGFCCVWSWGQSKIHSQIYAFLHQSTLQLTFQTDAFSRNWTIKLKASYVTLDLYVMLIRRLTPNFTSGVVHIWHSYARGMRTIHEVVWMIDRNKHPTHSEPVRRITNLSDSVRSWRVHWFVNVFVWVLDRSSPLVWQFNKNGELASGYLKLSCKLPWKIWVCLISVRICS